MSPQSHEELNIQILGTFQITLNGEHISLTDRETEILYYIILKQGEGSKVDRNELADWLSYDKKSLRPYLSRLKRSKLNENFFRDEFSQQGKNNDYLFLNHPGLTVDYFQIKKLLANNLSGSENDAIKISDLEKAINLYRGGSVTLKSISEGSDFGRYLTRIQNELRLQILQALIILIRYFSTRSQLSKAIQYTEHYFEIDPCNVAKAKELWRLYHRENRQLDAKSFIGHVSSLNYISECSEEISQAIIRDCDFEQQDKSPYPGLNPFEEDQSEYFFGRDKKVHELKQKIHEEKFVTLIGASGSGKSSLIKAGLIPHLKRETQWLIIVVRPNTNLIAEIIDEYLPFLEPQLLKSERLAEKDSQLKNFKAEMGYSLKEYLKLSLKETKGKNKLLLIIDQFEEIFASESAFNSHIKQLHELINGESEDLKLLISLRADFMGKAIEYGLDDAIFTLGPMIEGELKASIEEPARQVNLEIEEGLTHQIIRDVGNEPGNLPLMQFTMDELFRKRRNNTLMLSSYIEIGGITGALQRHSESVLATKLDEKDRVVLKKLFLRLIDTRKDIQLPTRRTASQSELFDIGIDWELVQKLADLRLLVTKKDQFNEEEGQVELVHESIIGNWEFLKNLVNEDSEFIHWRNRLSVKATEWKDSKIKEEKDALLLRGAQLSLAEKWLKERQQDLGVLEQGFIRNSQFLQDQEIEVREVMNKAISQKSRRLNLLATLGGGLGLTIFVIALLMPALMAGTSEYNSPYFYLVFLIPFIFGLLIGAMFKYFSDEIVEIVGSPISITSTTSGLICTGIISISLFVPAFVLVGAGNKFLIIWSILVSAIFTHLSLKFKRANEINLRQVLLWGIMIGFVFGIGIFFHETFPEKISVLLRLSSERGISLTSLYRESFQISETVTRLRPSIIVWNFCGATLFSIIFFGFEYLGKQLDNDSTFIRSLFNISSLIGLTFLSIWVSGNFSNQISALFSTISSSTSIHYGTWGGKTSQEDSITFEVVDFVGPKIDNLIFNVQDSICGTGHNEFRVEFAFINSNQFRVNPILSRNNNIVSADIDGFFNESTGEFSGKIFIDGPIIHMERCNWDLTWSASKQ